jgi:hypothetical protein
MHRVENQDEGQRAHKERRGNVMKKAILIICVLSVLALLAVPVVAGVLTFAFGPEYLSGSPPPLPGTIRQAGLERPTQIARIGIRSP